MKVKQIQIHHPQLGQIVINSEIDKNINDKIGTITSDCSKSPVYYHADIKKKEDNTFEIKNLNIIKPESINVGMIKTSCGCKSFITVITNKPVSEDIIVYPSGVMSVSYN